MNFGLLNQIPEQKSASERQLKPWNIYNVKFAGCRIEEIHKEENVYKILKVRFESEQGYYDTPIFFLADDERNTKKGSYTLSNGNVVETPSIEQQTYALIGQICMFLNPEGFKKLQANASKIKSFDELATYIVKITDTQKGKECQIKLVGRPSVDGRVYPNVPNLVRFNQKGELYACDTYIGNDLFFTDYQLGKKNEYENAKPTPMNKPSESILSSMDSSIDEFHGSEDDGLPF